MSHDMRFLWAVTAVVWLGTLFYVWSLIRRQNRLQRELDGLERTLKERLNS